MNPFNLQSEHTYSFQPTYSNLAQALCLDIDEGEMMAMARTSTGKMKSAKPVEGGRLFSSSALLWTASPLAGGFWRGIAGVPNGANQVALQHAGCRGAVPNILKWFGSISILLQKWNQNHKTNQILIFGLNWFIDHVLDVQAFQIYRSLFLQSVFI